MRPESTRSQAIPGRPAGSSAGFAWLRRFLGDPLPARDLAPFFERLALLLASGTAVPEALTQASSSSDAELRSICAAAAGPVAHGAPLHRALAPWAGRFPEIVLPVLEVGEVSGTLEGSARRLAAAFDRAAGIELRFRWGVCNPWLIALAVCAYMVIPTLIASPSFGLQLALTLLGEVAALYVFGRIALRALWRWRALRIVVDTVKLALPHMGIVVRDLSAARWGRSFATLWHCGVPVSTALEVASRSALNAAYEEALLRAARRTRAGASLHDGLAGTQMLPAHLLAIIHSGETSGRLADAIDRFVEVLEDEAMTMASKEFMAIAAGVELLLILAAIAGMGRIG